MIKSKKIRSKRFIKENSLKEVTVCLVLPVKLTKKQQREANVRLAEARKKSQAAMKGADQVRSSLLQLRFQIEEYLKENTFRSAMSFGNLLKQYITLQQIKRNVFAKEISIDNTVLSQFINEHRIPPDYLTIRLELHSSNLIPADYWFQLIHRQQEHYIRTDNEFRKA